MSLTDNALDEQIKRLLEHYRPGEPMDRFGGWIAEMDEAFSGMESVNDQTFALAVTRCIATRMEHRLPLVAEFRLYVEAEWHAYKRETAKQLPAPEPKRAAGPDPAFYARNIAIGKARQRRRKALIDAYRATLAPGVWKYGGEQSHHWRGKDTPNDDEIAAVLREMHKGGQINAATLASALELRCEVNVLNVAHEQSTIAVGVPGEAAPAGPTEDPNKPRVVFRWKDGKESRVTLMDETHARIADRWLRAHNTAEPDPAPPAA